MQDYQRGWDDAMAQASKKGNYDLPSLRQKFQEWRKVMWGADSSVVLAFLRWLEESDG